MIGARFIGAKSAVVIGAHHVQPGEVVGGDGADVKAPGATVDELLDRDDFELVIREDGEWITDPVAEED
jgi:hypothetical protein